VHKLLLLFFRQATDLLWNTTKREKADGKSPTYDDVTPLNSEKYVMFQVGKLRFLDS